MKVATRPAPITTEKEPSVHEDEDEVQEKELSDSDPTWSRREAARLRQIMIGKARPEYRRYVTEIPVEKRDPQQPTTPDPRARVSKRQFDRSLGEWRRRLHEFDVRNGAAPQPPSKGDSPGKEGDAANRKSGSTRRSRATRTSATGKSAGTSRFGVQDDDIDETAGVVRLRLAEQLPELPPAARVAWTLADKLADHVTLADKLPDPVMPQQSRLALRTGPQPPQDKRSPPMPMRDEKVFPEAGAIKNGEYRYDLVKDLAQYVPVDPIKLADGLRFTVYNKDEFADPPSDYDDESVSSSSPRFVAPSRNGSPHTPPRKAFIVSPPASLVTTPPRVVWAMDTPSPDRMYQMMPPPPVLNLAAMGQICELGTGLSWMPKSM